VSKRKYYVSRILTAPLLSTLENLKSQYRNFYDLQIEFVIDNRKDKLDVYLSSLDTFHKQKIISLPMSDSNES